MWNRAHFAWNLTAALAAGLLLSRGVLNPAVAVAMGLALTPATWATLLSGVACAGLFRVLAPATAGEDRAAEGRGVGQPERRGSGRAWATPQAGDEAGGTEGTRVVSDRAAGA